MGRSKSAPRALIGAPTPKEGRQHLNASARRERTANQVATARTRCRTRGGGSSRGSFSTEQHVEEEEEHHEVDEHYDEMERRRKGKSTYVASEESGDDDDDKEEEEVDVDEDEDEEENEIVPDLSAKGKKNTDGNDNDNDDDDDDLTYPFGGGPESNEVLYLYVNHVSRKIWARKKERDNLRVHNHAKTLKKWDLRKEPKRIRDAIAST